MTILVSRSSVHASLHAIGLALTLFAGMGWAQLPEGPGKAETERICKQCHELERSISVRQDRAGWQATMDKMAALGAPGTQKEFDAVVEYLAPVRERYAELRPDAGALESTLAAGAEKARASASETLADVREAMGIGTAE